MPLNKKRKLNSSNAEILENQINFSEEKPKFKRQRKAKIDEQNLFKNFNLNTGITQIIETQNTKSALDNLFQDFRCPICLEIANRCHITNPCGHIFCQSCIHEWLKVKPTCPSCQQRVFSTTYSRQITTLIESFAKSQKFSEETSENILSRLEAPSDVIQSIPVLSLSSHALLRNHLHRLIQRLRASHRFILQQRNDGTNQQLNSNGLESTTTLNESQNPVQPQGFPNRESIRNIQPVRLREWNLPSSPVQTVQPVGSFTSMPLRQDNLNQNQLPNSSNFVPAGNQPEVNHETNQFARYHPHPLHTQRQSSPFNSGFLTHFARRHSHQQAVISENSPSSPTLLLFPVLTPGQMNNPSHGTQASTAISNPASGSSSTPTIPAFLLLPRSDTIIVPGLPLPFAFQSPTTPHQQH